ncbi:hypothetical protein [Acidithiobacillus sp.]|uniref:hypothetical protein n=1 Tax=Acidithiobacillus sp. TaxID=1872118 RepID=UPI00258AC363|nr:hypothetical protein [Acidithiobacillus sp.]MDD5375761.1 hypothetical protein [Acidithiobacillus sp.]MDD5547111.1 hypothetical protein [Candidatus Omnitrophota bacterium]
MLKVGDIFWSAHYGMSEVTKTCPVCYGKRCVTLILGNDDKIELPCDYCRRGYEEPRGTKTEYEFTSGAEQETVDEVRIEETSKGRKVEYLTFDHHVVREDEAYATKEEAEERCKQLIAERMHDEATRAEHIKANQAKSYSWNAGYHMREAKREEESAARHRARAKLCKERTKEDA